MTKAERKAKQAERDRNFPPDATVEQMQAAVEKAMRAESEMLIEHAKGELVGLYYAWLRQGMRLIHFIQR